MNIKKILEKGDDRTMKAATGKSIAEFEELANDVVICTNNL